MHLKTKIVVTCDEDFMFKIGHSKPVQEVCDFMALTHTCTITCVYKNVTTTQYVAHPLTCKVVVFVVRV
jgi:hypothetical protein